MPPTRVIARGFSATTYDTGDGYVLRVAHDEEARQRHLHEVRLLPIIKDWLAGYELPAPTEVLPASAQYPHGAVRCPLLRGDHPDAAVDPQSIAEFLMRLHAAPLDAVAGFLPPYEAWLDEQIRTARDGLVAVSRVLDSDTAAWLNRFVDDLPDLLPGDVPPALVHGDFWSENLLVRNGRLAAVLDWEAANIGHVAVDLSGLWYLGAPLVQQVAAALGCSSDVIRTAHHFRVVRELYGAAWSRRRGDIEELSESAAKVIAVVGDVRSELD